MNRYRTIPGTGPSTSKATSTTTCQKCLKKGHYSYECKASVQSRPYTSRPSRSQQLRNPKLKPTLAEHKMEEPADASVDLGQPSSKPKRPSAQDQSDEPSEPGRKFGSSERRRSASVSSNSSVATISTGVSEPEREDDGVERPGPRSRDRRPRSLSSTTSSPHMKTEPDVSHRASRLDQEAEEVQSKDDLNLGRHPVGRDVRHDDKDSSPPDHEQHRHRKRDRRSRSPGILPDKHQRQETGNRSYRERSLSPYSRRLALTQAMNARR